MSISTFDLTEYDTEHGYGPEDTNDTPAPPPPATDPHEPKEPMRAAIFEFLDALVSDERLSPQERRAIAESFDALAAERDEWKRRAAAAEAEAVRIAQVHQHEWLARASAREAFENYAVRVMAASGADANFDDCFRNIIVEYDRVLARADKAEAERDAARAENAELNELFELQGRRLSDATKRWQAVTGEHGTLPDLGALLAWLLGEIDKANATDPRIAAWRALDAEQRSYRVEDLRTWADLVEAGAAPDGADHGPSPLRIAAAALEALGEK